jgi:hypothetical protein
MPTPTNEELIDEINTLLGPGIIPPYTFASDAADIFEGYVFGLLVRAARNEGAATRYVDVSGAETQNLILRSSPGSIWSQRRAFTHAELAFPNKPTLEAHVGIFVSGRSKVEHECDVDALYEDEANTCRQNQVHPRQSKVLLSVECKFYSSGLGIDLARSFMGLVTDISTGSRFFVTNTSYANLEAILSYHNLDWEHDLAPINTRVAQRLLCHFEGVFRNFKATRQ